jgi:hypothetical protein
MLHNFIDVTPEHFLFLFHQQTDHQSEEEGELCQNCLHNGMELRVDKCRLQSTHLVRRE